ncbi:MAG: DUF4097 family beta strand repeat-containing protein [Treponema sp.]|nr:DUF4097 family beta strand repeat-containing protein [Treponema sp.]
MNKEIFLQKLTENLVSLNKEEREKVIAYYTEMISDKVENGAAEDAVIQDLGSPADIALQICAEYKKAADSLPAKNAGIPDSEPSRYTAAGDVKTIIVSAQNIHVDVRSVPAGRVRVLFDPLPTDKISVSEADGVYTFIHSIPFHLFNWFGLFHAHGGITLEIPESFSGDVSVQTDNARLTVENLRHLKSGTFTTDNARIVVSGTECGKLSAHTSNGKVELENCTGQTCKIKTNNGRITANSCTFPAGLDLHTDNASINADRVKADTIIFKTNNGSINALIDGDARNYAIHSHTSNGQNTLPADWTFPEQTKQLSAETSNAHIAVKFTEGGMR